VIELILPDWFYQAVLDDALVLTIDPAYFGLTGGLERWLYRIVRKHGGRQRAGWAFGLRHLYEKSASLSPIGALPSNCATWRSGSPCRLSAVGASRPQRQ
jgi:plasmid replication initiation protein